MRSIDLNCDLGEGGDDAALMPLVTSANIACGGHAGDETTMTRAVELALEYNANIGAHPSYEDRANFGRAEMNVPAEALTRSIASQIARFREIVIAKGGTIRHVKPHGALYNAAIRNPAVARAILDAVWRVDPALTIVTMHQGCLLDQAIALGNPVVIEGFVDRTYQSDGTLTPRSEPDALHAREIDAADQSLWMARDGVVRSIDGSWIAIGAQTLCVHGDGKSALSLLRLVRTSLNAAGIAIKAF